MREVSTQKRNLFCNSLTVRCKVTFYKSNQKAKDAESRAEERRQKRRKGKKLAIKKEERLHVSDQPTALR